MPEESDGPLALATIEDILVELKRRYECVVICTYKTRDDNTYETMPWFTGVPPMALGLTDILKKSIWTWRKGTRVGPVDQD